MRARGMIGFGAILAMVAFSNGQAADVKIQVGDVNDSRTTGQFFANLKIELKLLGDDLEGAKGLRCTVTKAIDDTGRNLIKEEKKRNEFSDLDQHNPNQTQVIIELKNPSRKAAMVKEISGEIEIFKPDNDPASTATVTILTGEPAFSVSHPNLGAAQIEMNVLSKEQYEKEEKASEGNTQAKAVLEQMGKEMGKAFAGIFGGTTDRSKNRVIMRIKDPQLKLIKVEFLDASAKVIKQEGRMTMGDVRFYDLSEPLSQQLRVYVATPKSVIKAPLMLKDLALP